MRPSFPTCNLPLFCAAYDVGGEPGLSLRAGHPLHAFQAHRVGHVTAMARTPQGELWTGSSRGYIRWAAGRQRVWGGEQRGS